MVVLMLDLSPLLIHISSDNREEATQSLTRSCEEQDDMSEWAIGIVLCNMDTVKVYY